MKIFDTTLTHLQESLDVRLVEHNVLAGNIANSDTPGYKPKELNFSEAMNAAQQAAGADGMTATDAHHMSPSGAAAEIANSRAMEAAMTLVRDGAGTSPSMDGNQVDLDRTMAGLAENSLQYGASARAAGKKLAILRYVVSDGGS
jgi:flagellar basal-body rod protein FlgB